jgi:hypothetical protein
MSGIIGLSPNMQSGIVGMHPTHSVIQMLENSSTTTVTANNSTGNQSALYSTFPGGRVYVDLVSKTFVPKSATSKFIITGSAAINSMTARTTGAWGTSLVKDNTTGYYSSSYPYYGRWGTTGGYGPDITYTWVVNSTSTSSVTFYLKGYAYGEGGTGTQQFQSLAAQLTILEIAT